MTTVFQSVLLLSIICVGLCEQQQQDVQFGKLQGLIPIKVRRTFRSLNNANMMSPVFGDGLLRSYQPRMVTPFDYSFQLRQRNPRWPYFGSYQPSYLSSSQTRMRSSFSPYRRSAPVFPSSDTFGSDEVDNSAQPSSSSEQVSRLRFLGWLFGRPPVSQYPDYSILEEAAGISYGSRLPSVGYPRPHTPYVVEECVELLDPVTDHIIEECQEVPVYH